ncbi:UPF0158 family protein [Ileibacterium valens]|uniref:N-acetyltransferase domain-containing protein n=1 Tax=Ileibacterium valens TaxID=1862668 RepID=A0A1U7NEH8_9FIRM|nr:UPF0158 family protein [Ileibacterium valens]OLU37977.1 hypothetical protein BO222_09255 [Ileibacterium valens]OLU39958.1 hypothetical protein BO224_06525 [Erysipelotrichaceae bacterium NYU-BL-E8]OLU40497.1 hypothetical protein BM735_05515 [Erysipelotrichaceae bacterium NYU-BL-F16]
MTLDLDDLIDAMMNSQQGVDYYLNTKTGEIIMRSEYLPISELNDIENELDENWDFILEIPDQREVGGLSINRKFIWNLPDGKAKDALNTALNGKGAYRRFKDAAKNYGLLDRWFEFEDDYYTEYARNWCKDNEVAFTEVPKIVYRHATRRDLKTLIDLKKKELGIQEDSLDFELERYFSNQMRMGNLYQIFAWWKMKIVATGAVVWNFYPPTLEQPNGRKGLLVNFWCEEEMKDKGYLEEITKRLIEETKARNISEIVAQSNQNELLEKCGFEKLDNSWVRKIRLK